MPGVYNKRRGNAPEGAVYVGRGSPWGNPFRIQTRRGWSEDDHLVFADNREEVIERFRHETLPTLDLTELRGKDLVCWCAPKACHADVLLEAANA